MITQGKRLIMLSLLLKLKGIIKVDKILPASKQFNQLIIHLILYVIAGIFLMPTFLFAGEVITTYDKKTIWYPSMFVGRIWVKSGEAPPRILEGGEGRISSGAKEKSFSNLKSDSSSNVETVEKKSSTAITQSTTAITTESVRRSEIKKKLKQKRLRAVQAMEKEKAQKTASNQSSPTQASNKENQKTSEVKTNQPIKTASSKAAGFVSPGARLSGRNWHHKQELYDVECGQKLVRVVATYYFDREETLLSSKVYPGPQWYHIYPRSLEEKLYVELCHPSN